jgi:hypothetical protein
MMRAIPGQKIEPDRISIAKRRLERVVDLGTDPIGWAGLDPNDSPILMRDKGTRQIYAFDLDFR